MNDLVKVAGLLLLFSYPMTATAEWVDIRCTTELDTKIDGKRYKFTNFLKIDMEAGLIADYDRGKQYPIATIKGDWIWWYLQWETEEGFSSGVSALNRDSGVMYTSFISMTALQDDHDPHVTHTWECSRPLL